MWSSLKSWKTGWLKFRLKGIVGTIFVVYIVHSFILMSAPKDPASPANQVSVISQQPPLKFQSPVNQERDEVDYFNLPQPQRENLAQNDSGLLEYIRTHHLFPPSSKPYNLTNPDKDPTEKFDSQWKIAYKVLGNKTNGIFIECGASNGEFLSNTLTLERNYGWTGLLIEADPRDWPALFARQRKAWIATACLSVKPFPEVITMQHHKSWKAVATQIENNQVKKNYEAFKTKCLPLFSILSAIPMLEIDYFSLDIEFVEIPVLRTVPFDSLHIKVISIELFETDREQKIEFLSSKGYTCIHIFAKPYTHDGWFVHKSLYKPEMKISNCDKIVFE